MLKSNTLVFLSSLDKKFDAFQQSKIGRFAIDKILFRKKGFYSAITILSVLLLSQFAALSYGNKWEIFFDNKIQNPEYLPKIMWEILSLFSPTGNLIIIIFLIFILIGIFAMRNKELASINTPEYLIKSLKEKTSNILHPINTSVPYNAKTLELDRTSVVEQIKTELPNNKIVIVSGVGGVGKTAVIKKLHEDISEQIPIYIFKGSEFDIVNINNLFGNFTLQNFIEANAGQNKKIIVIDSAERLLDIENRDPFKEFLSAIINKNWEIVFTTRNGYLEDLNLQLIELYRITPLNINIPSLTAEELQKISKEYDFELPNDRMLLDLLKIPLYLSEYLMIYEKSHAINYTEFKEKIWKKTITNSDSSREKCFLELALKRANEGQFYIFPDCKEELLSDLVLDDVLGKENTGYFITHDIYEEWALEKIIELQFFRREQNNDFFTAIGNSLPIRRSFRTWVEKKLQLEDENIHSFIESVIDDEKVDSFWRDEVIISVLLSNYSNSFFQYFKKKFIENDFSLLKQISFLLRIACKESDLQTLKQWGIGTINDELQLSMIFTKPKGQGWQSFIQYIFEHRGEIGLENIEFILPVLHDWNSKFQEGDTTKLSGLLSVKYYQEIMKGSTYGHSEVLKKLLQIIASSAMEIKDELITIFDTVLENKYTEHNDPYADLTKMVLTQLDGVNIVKSIPNKVLEIADLFWFKKPEPLGRFHSRLGEEENYCIGNFQHDYYPASAYQTPIHWLLQYEQKATIDFILAFTNKTIQCYVDSSSSSSINTVKVFLHDEKVIEQYHSMNLWLMYRGNNGPNILQSIHMALEKFFLERAEKTDSETLEYWLLYLLENSKSSSVTSVISSIVLAYPEKTFNVAAILFKTKEFIIYDLTRWSSESNTLAPLSMRAYGEIFQKERIESRKLEQRKNSLEHQFLSYQFFRTEEVSQEESEYRQKVLWNILDHYYSELSQGEDDKTWKMFLSRMDKRKMSPTFEKHEKGVLINFNPKIEPSLKEYSDKVQEETSERTKYSRLYLWARNKFENNKDYEKYTEFNENPLVALEKVKEIFSIPLANRDRYILYDSIPSDVCAVLMRDYIGYLSATEKEYCKGILLEFATLWFKEDYRFQISDGTEAAISVLPILMNEFPQEREDIKLILFLLLFNDYSIGMSGDNCYSYAINSIKMYLSDSYDVQSLLYGYLLLKPKYQELTEKIRIENHSKGIYSISREVLFKKFTAENEPDLDKIKTNQITQKDIGALDKIDLNILQVALEIISSSKSNEKYKKTTIAIIHIFTQLLFENRGNKVNYETKHAFLKQLAYLNLQSNQEDIPSYMEPFIDRFNASETISDLLNELIYAEDSLNTYQQFWYIWDDLLFDKVVELSSKEDGCYIMNNVIKSYLFAKAPWTQNIKEWHSIKEGNKRFFKLISEKVGHCPTVLYSLVKLLNGVGSIYLKDGLSWISKMLKNNENLLTDELDSDTIFYMEIIMRKYLFMYHDEIKKTKKLKSEALIILDYMIKRGSASAYMWREMIY